MIAVLGWQFASLSSTAYAATDWSLAGSSTYLSGDTSDQSNWICGLDVVNGALYAATENGVFERNQSGWQQVGTPHLSGNSNDYSNVVLALTDSNGVLYAGTDVGVYAYNGSAWTLVGPAPHLSGSTNDGSQYVFALTVGNGTIYAGTMNGVYQYNGQTWSLVGGSPELDNTDRYSNDIAGVAYLGNTVFATSGSDVYAAENGAWTRVGDTFTPPGADIEITGVGSLAVVDGQLYAGNGVGVFEWNNNTWSQVGTSLGGMNYIRDFGGVLYAATTNGVYTLDNGTWRLIGSNTHLSGDSSDTSNGIKDIEVFKGTLYAGARTDGVYMHQLPTLTTPTLATGLQGSSYSQTIAASGGIQPYSYSVQSGTLPTGLTLHSDGTIVGTPQVSGNFSFTVKVTDSAGEVGTSTYNLDIAAPAPVESTSTVDAQQVFDSNGGTIAATHGGFRASLSVPNGAFSSPLQITLTSGNTANVSVPNNMKVLTMFGVNFANGHTPSRPLTLTIYNSAITPQSQVYKVVNGKLIPMTATVTSGQAIISFSTDPDFVVTQSTKPVAGATSPETGLASAPWELGGSIAILVGSVLVMMYRRSKKA